LIRAVGHRLVAVFATLALGLGSAACGDGSSVIEYTASYTFVQDIADLRSLVAEINYGAGIGPYSNATTAPVRCRPVGKNVIIAVSSVGIGVATVHVLASNWTTCDGCTGDAHYTNDTDVTDAASCAGCNGDSDPALGLPSGLLAGQAAFECDFQLQGVVRIENFAARTISAEDSVGRSIIPLPDLDVAVVQSGVREDSRLPRAGYDVTFALPSDVGRIGALQFEVDYLGDGGWLGALTSVQCQFLAPYDLSACNDRGNGRLACAATSVPGVASPHDVVRCSLGSTELVDASAFAIRVIDAADSQLRYVDTAVVVSSIVAREVDAEEPDEDPVSTPGYDVTVGVLDDVGPLGALQFDVRFLGSNGGWIGAKAGVACRWSVGSGLNACNDVGAGRVRCATVDIDGFATPTDPVATCALKSSDPQLGVGDFRVTVVDATSPEFEPVRPRMAVTAVERR
jgi:hypothetical protein